MNDDALDAHDEGRDNQPADGPDSDTGSTSQDEPGGGSSTGAGDRAGKSDHDPEPPGDSNERADERVEVVDPE